MTYATTDDVNVYCPKCGAVKSRVTIHYACGSCFCDNAFVPSPQCTQRAKLAALAAEIAALAAEVERLTAVESQVKEFRQWAIDTDHDYFDTSIVLSTCEQILAGAFGRIR